MNTNTAIAIALALVVVGIFFITPGLSPFGSAPATSQTSATATTDTSTATTTNPTIPAANTMTTADGLQITDEVVGTGATAAAGQTVTVNYVGMLTNGTVFDASANHGGTFSFPLGAGQVIPGWDEGIVGMKVGGKRRLVIPAALAYGSRAIGNIIPANSTLIFEVELVSVASTK